jgi:hypothetical protein
VDHEHKKGEEGHYMRTKPISPASSGVERAFGMSGDMKSHFDDTKLTLRISLNRFLTANKRCVLRNRSRFLIAVTWYRKGAADVLVPSKGTWVFAKVGLAQRRGFGASMLA